MLSIVIGGFLIGILVSAPMGPIGLLCIQRTLYKGRWHGFFTGMGAALSDLVYALITCLGIGFVVMFIENHQSILQITGSILLIFFGIYIFRTNPKFRKPSANSRKRSYSQDTLTAFIITFSNPLVVFLFIALFARFNLIDPDNKLLSSILCLSGLFCGAMFWWFSLAMAVSLLRGKFQERGLRIVNRMVGCVIVVLAVVGLVVSVVQYDKTHKKTLSNTKEISSSFTPAATNSGMSCVNISLNSSGD